MNENEKLSAMDAKVIEKSLADSERVKKRRFTVLDFGLIVVILLSILGIGFRTLIADWILKSVYEESVTVRFKAESVTSEQLSHMSAGHALTFNGAAFGTLKSLTSQNATSVVENKNEDGTVSFVTVEDKNSFTVYGEIELTGRYTDKGLVCQENTNLYVGKILNIQSSSYSVTVIITEIPRK